MFGIHRMISYPSIVLLLFTLISFGGDAYSTPMPTADALRQVIVAHHYAIGENRLEEAMGYYHSQSPDLAQTREDIEYGFSQYLLRTTTMSFCYNGREGEYALAAAKHRHLMISGIKFIEHIVDVVYQLREEQGNWKIWTKRDSLNDIGKLSNCTQTDSILYAEPDSE